MDEQNIPIDINTNKLLDWLVSRRHVNKNWQNTVLDIREKINNAIQDMPAHDGIIKLLSGQHINYFHCVNIIEILKETEKDTKNLFGRYGSQRMKDWQDILSSYEKDNVYLAEAAQMLIRNVTYEIPSLKKQITKLEQSQIENEKKIKDYSKTEATALKEFSHSCEQLGITGKNIKNELLELLKTLPHFLEDTLHKIKTVTPAIEVYIEFNKFLMDKNNPNVLNVLKYLVKNGNTTTYEYFYGEAPTNIEEPELVQTHENNSESNGSNAEIDFGDVDLSPEIDFGDVKTEEISIEWSSNEDSFEIVTYEDVSAEESGIIVEKTGIAKGVEALTILDNPKTREDIVNNLIELDSFFKMRLYEMSLPSNESDMLAISQMQKAPVILQTQTIESIATLRDAVNIALDALTNETIQHLFNLKHSQKYVDILTASLSQKLTVIDRMITCKRLLEQKIKESGHEIRKTEPLIKLLIEKTKTLQKQLQEDISKKYKGRIVNIVGGINLL